MIIDSQDEKDPEFVLLMPGTSLQGAAALVEALRAKIAAHVFTFEGNTIYEGPLGGGWRRVILPPRL